MTQAAQPQKKFKELSVGQKLQFIGKLVIFICSFGFAFPLLLSTE